METSAKICKNEWMEAAETSREKLAFVFMKAWKSNFNALWILTMKITIPASHPSPGLE